MRRMFRGDASTTLLPPRYPSSTKTRAIDSFSRDHGTSMLALRAPMPLRMRLRRSAIGSVIMMLPARLRQARDLPLARQVPQAQAAHAEAAEERARPAAERAPIVRPHLELRGPGRLYHETGLGHRFFPQTRKGMPSARRSALPSASVRAVVQMTIVMPFTLSTFSRLISGKITCSRRP